VVIVLGLNLVYNRKPYVPPKTVTGFHRPTGDPSRRPRYFDQIPSSLPSSSARDSE
jgi:hypothetical protein